MWCQTYEDKSEKEVLEKWKQSVEVRMANIKDKKMSLADVFSTYKVLNHSGALELVRNLKTKNIKPIFDIRLFKICFDFEYADRDVYMNLHLKWEKFAGDIIPMLLNIKDVRVARKLQILKDAELDKGKVYAKNKLIFLKFIDLFVHISMGLENYFPNFSSYF
jgi:hypothetical protein